MKKSNRKAIKLKFKKREKKYTKLSIKKRKQIERGKKGK